MSNAALTWAFGTDVPSGAKFVLVVLADRGSDHSGENWTCFPSIDSIAEATGCAGRSVERHLKWLEADGWIARRRRRRSDGTLGSYDYELIRARPEAGPAGCMMEGKKTLFDQGDDADKFTEQPAANLAGGEGADTTRQIRHDHPTNSTQPPAKLSGLYKDEPSIEPSGNPQGAREPGSDGFRSGFIAYPQSGRARTDQGKARAAWALACDQAGGVAVVVEAVSRYAAVAGDHPGDHGAPAMQRWLSEGRWQAWLEPVVAAPVILASACPVPEALRQAIGERSDAGKLASYLDPAAWDGEARTLTARTAFAARWLRETLRDIPQARGVRVLAPGDGGEA